MVIEVLTGFRNFVTRFLPSKAPRLLARASKDAQVVRSQDDQNKPALTTPITADVLWSQRSGLAVGGRSQWRDKRRIVFCFSSLLKFALEPKVIREHDEQHGLLTSSVTGR